MSEIVESIKRDYSKLSERTKEEIKDRYENIINVLLCIADSQL